MLTLTLTYAQAVTDEGAKTTLYGYNDYTDGVLGNECTNFVMGVCKQTRLANPNPNPNPNQGEGVRPTNDREAGGQGPLRLPAPSGEA